MMITYSIIIPHKDIPRLLQRCLDSIPQRPDLEVIVVDDNSDPGIVDFDHFPGQDRADTTIIFDKSGKGAGRARNIGLEHARGRWLLFADADDLFVEGMYDIVRKGDDSDADVICFKIRSVMSADLNKDLDRMTYVNKYIDEYLTAGDDRFIRLRYPTPWGKMYRRDLVERYGFRFDEIKYANDYFFAVCTGYYAREVKATDEILYIYTMREGSLTEAFGAKPDELAVRAEVSFRVQKMFKELHVDIDQQRPFKWFLMKSLGHNRPLFRYYWERIGEAYPSRYVALQVLSQGKSLKFRAKLFFYSMWVWFRPLSFFKNDD